MGALLAVKMKSPKPTKNGISELIRDAGLIPGTPEYKIFYHRAWREQNRDAVKIQNQKYHEKNKDARKRRYQKLKDAYNAKRRSEDAKRRRREAYPALRGKISACNKAYRARLRA